MSLNSEIFADTCRTRIFSHFESFNRQSVDFIQENLGCSDLIS